METTNFRDRLATLVSNSEATHATNLLAEEQATRTSITSLASRIPNSSLNSRTNLRVRTSVHRTCRPLCVCVCHRESRLTSPKWMTSAIGTLFLGYSGVPISFLSANCTEVACCSNKSALINVQYWFPSWFLQRMVILRNRYSPSNGNQISVRTPRLAGSFTEIFAASLSGNLEMVRFLLSKRKASPFDVARDGNIPIFVSKNHTLSQTIVFQFANK